MAQTATKRAVRITKPSRAFHTVKVTKILRGYSMRNGVHADRRLYATQHNDHEVVLCLNKRQTIARLYDAASAVHSYYAPPGERFDADMLQQMVATVGLWLNIPPKEAK